MPLYTNSLTQHCPALLHLVKSRIKSCHGNNCSHEHVGSSNFIRLEFQNKAKLNNLPPPPKDLKPGSGGSALNPFTREPETGRSLEFKSSIVYSASSGTAKGTRQCQEDFLPFTGSLALDCCLWSCCVCLVKDTTLWLYFFLLLPFIPPRTLFLKSSSWFLNSRSSLPGGKFTVFAFFGFELPVSLLPKSLSAEWDPVNY